MPPREALFLAWYHAQGIRIAISNLAGSDRHAEEALGIFSNAAYDIHRTQPAPSQDEPLAFVDWLLKIPGHEAAVAAALAYIDIYLRNLQRTDPDSMVGAINELNQQMVKDAARPVNDDNMLSGGGRRHRNWRALSTPAHC